MNDQDASPTADALDALIDHLLACGGALSQMIGHMQKAEASGLSSPDAPPILDVAHSLIRDVNSDLPEQHTDQEIWHSAAIVAQVTTAICENIFFTPPAEMRRMSGRPRPAGAQRRRRRSRRGRR